MSNNRARKRAIRRLSERYDVPYSVAARRVELGGIPGDQGRTVYPKTSDTHRGQLVASWHQRAFDQRVRDTRIAVQLPDGRAQHLAGRFPPTRGEPGTGVGGLYHGERRVEALTRLYGAVAIAQPQLVPSAGDLAWALDLAARLHADTGTTAPGALQILDALLTIADDGHAPGTRVRLAGANHRPRLATILNACWALTGPPIGYVVQLDGASDTIQTKPRELVVLSSAEPLLERDRKFDLTTSTPGSKRCSCGSAR